MLTVQLCLWIIGAMGWRQAADLQLEQQHPGLLFSNPIQTPSAFTRAWESRVGSDGFLCILPPHQSPQRNSSLNFPPSLLILGVSQPRFTLSKDTFVPKASINRSSSRETLLTFHRTLEHWGSYKDPNTTEAFPSKPGTAPKTWTPEELQRYPGNREEAPIPAGQLLDVPVLREMGEFLPE